MTEEEKQSIISEILSAIRTNSLTIDDLTQLDTMPSDAYIEISGGRRISCETLKQAVASLFDDDEDDTGVFKIYKGRLGKTGSKTAENSTRVGILPGYFARLCGAYR